MTAITKEGILKIRESLDPKQAANEVVDWVCDNIESFIDNHRKSFNVSFSSIDAYGLVQLEPIEKAFISLDIASSGDQVSIDEIKEAAAAGMSGDEVDRAVELVEKYKSGEVVSQAEMDEVRELLDAINGAEMEAVDESVVDVDQSDIIDEEAEKLSLLYGMVDEVKGELISNKELLEKLFNKLIFYYELCGFREGIPVEKDLDGYVKIEEFEYYPYEMPIVITPRKPKLDEEGNVVLDENEQPVMEEGEKTVEKLSPVFSLDMMIEFWEKKPMTSMF